MAEQSDNESSWWGSIVQTLACGATPRKPAGTATPRRLSHIGDLDGSYPELAEMRLRAIQLDSEIEDLKRTLCTAGPATLDPSEPELPLTARAAQAVAGVGEAVAGVGEAVAGVGDQIWDGLVSWGSPSRGGSELPPPPPPPEQAAHAARLSQDHELEQERLLRRRRQEDERVRPPASSPRADPQTSACAAWLTPSGRYPCRCRPRPRRRPSTTSRWRCWTVCAERCGAVPALRLDLKPRP